MKKLLMLALSLCMCFGMFQNGVYGMVKKDEGEIKVITTKFHEKNAFNESMNISAVDFQKELAWDGGVIDIYPYQIKQEMLGIGGALTDSAVYVINTLTEEKQKEIYDAYFSMDGSAYTIVRSHMGSADFSTREYSYATDKDESINSNMENFTIVEDMSTIIPAVKRAYQYNEDIKFFAAPWAPPAWMKESGYRWGNGDGSAINAGSISTVPNHMKKEYYPLYAKYFSKYIENYKEQGIDVYSVSLQNEAQNNPDWEACYWPKEDAVEFIAEHLGPELERAGFEDAKLLVWDWDKQEGAVGKGDGFLSFNRYLMDSAAGKYIHGVGYHWYGPLDIGDEIAKRPTWAVDDFDNISTLRGEYPDKHYIATEGCQEKGPWLGSVEPAKRYVFDMLNDFRNYTEGWIDWNMVLNTSGGPLYREKNYCHAPIMVDEESGEITYNPAYFVLKHMSRTIRPGDISIRTEDNMNSYKDENGLQHGAFIDKDSGLVKVIVGNITNKPQEFVLREGGRMAKCQIDPLTLKTFIFEKGVEVREDAALNKQSSASSYEKNIIYNYKPHRAFDGDLKSRWASDWNNHGEWIQVDLGEEKTILGVDLNWEWGWKNIYEIQVSDDGEDWTTAIRVDGSPDGNGDTNNNLLGNRKEIRISFEPVNGRYVRMKGVMNKQGYGYSLYEMKTFIN